MSFVCKPSWRHTRGVYLHLNTAWIIKGHQWPLFIPTYWDVWQIKATLWKMSIHINADWHRYASSWTVVGKLDLTHWGRDKMAAIYQTAFSNAFPWMKMYEFRLKFVRKGSINNTPALVQIMAWRRLGDKPLSGLMMVRLPTHICVTRPQWVNKLVCHIQIQALNITKNILEMFVIDMVALN